MLNCRQKVFRTLAQAIPVRRISTRSAIFNRISSCNGNNFIRSASRCFSAESSKLLQVVQGEIHHEKSNYEAPSTVKSFLEKSDWKFTEKDGDVNMTLKKTVGGLLNGMSSGNWMEPRIRV